MPSNSLLFAINNEGRVYALSTNGSFWREFMYLGLEFKTLSSIPHFLWAVGGDRQVYLHVHGLEIPIRVKEESYENERWIPLEGFSNRLLPTDRYHFSSQDGTKDRSIDRIRLPSMAWQWEGDWQLELTLDGQPLDHDGWSYAVDFPAQFGPTKRWKSCVRRRKWIRYRKYSAMNSWCAIAPLHKDPTQEPFIDIDVGGHQVPYAPAGSLSVWAITAHGRVMFRSGASTTAPEGLRWTNIAMPPSCDVKQISVGPTGLVWTLLWSGRALVRTGVTRDCPTGDSWLEVKSPNDTKLSSVSVGYDAVWALSSDGRVWFRKGVNGNSAGASEAAAMGTGWLEIGGNMVNISVAANDQVFAIGEVDKSIYWRSGVSATELSGKRWRTLQAPLHLSRASSLASFASRSSPHSKHRSLTTLNEPTGDRKSDLILQDSWEESHSAPIEHTLPLKPATLKEINRPITDAEVEQMDLSGKSFETTLKNPRAWSPVRSVGSVVGMEAHPESDSSVFDGDSGLYCEDEVDQAAWGDCDTSWTFVAAGGCIMDPVQLPHWFADSHSGTSAELNAPWRLELLNGLKIRNQYGNVDLSNYGMAIDEKGWTRSCEARQIHANGSSEECILSVHWHAMENVGTLSVFNPDGAKIKYILNLSEVTCVTTASEPGCPRLMLTSPQQSSNPIKLQFISEMEQEEWLNLLVDITSQMNGLSGKPSPNSIWSVTSLGDIITWDSLASNTCLEKDGLFTKEIPVFGKDMVGGFVTPLHNNFTSGSELEIKGCLHDTVVRFYINLQGPEVVKQRHKLESEVSNIPFHFNPRFEENAVICNTKVSSLWGDEERHDQVPFTAGQEFSIRIISEIEGYRIIVNDVHYGFYKHRLSPDGVTAAKVMGPLKLYSMEYRSTSIIVGPEEMVWRLMGGHLRRVECNNSGVVWGISLDYSPWAYTGGWGGAALKGIGNSEGLHSMLDTQTYFVYENQRWNPISGYTSTGLPTDRYMWSDITGKHKRTRELTKLLNRHWHWISEWIVDYNTPGGVDSDGWQYATDFPAPYHGKKLFTDCVRRRRWFRKAQLITEGPWTRAGNTAIVDLSIGNECDGEVPAWAVTVAGDAVYRNGITNDSPGGVSWQHVNSPQPLAAISSYDNILWAVGRKGEIYFREGISSQNATGTNWRLIEAPKFNYGSGVKPPAGFGVKSVSLAKHRAWVLLTTGIVALRTGVTPDQQAGKHWKYCTDGDVTFKQLSSGERELWAVSAGGDLYRRLGTTSTGVGTSWQLVLSAGCAHVTAKGNSF